MRANISFNKNKVVALPDNGLELNRQPIKAVRELGSERREPVRSLSVAGAGNLGTPPAMPTPKKYIHRFGKRTLLLSISEEASVPHPNLPPR